MRCLSALSLALVALAPVASLAVDGDWVARFTQDLPVDVAGFVKKKILCQHFGSEPPGPDKSEEFLKDRVDENCVGLLNEEVKLRGKYSKDQKVLAAILKDNFP